MKLLKSAILIILLLLAVQVEGWCATKYLRSAGGNFSANETWSTTSGGSADTTAPTSNDDVICDPNSGSSVLTINSTSTCRNLDFTGFVGTFTGNTTWTTCSGDITLGSGMTYSLTSRITGTGINNKLTTNGVTMGGGFGVYAVNAYYTLQDNANFGTGAFNCTYGTINTNGKTVSCGLFSTSNASGTETFILGNSTITCTSLDLTAANTTLTYNTSSIILNQSATGAMSFAHGSCQFYNLTLNGFNDKVSQKLFAGNLTVNNNLSLQGNSITNRLWVRSDTTGTKRTLTAKTVDLDNVDFQDITFAGDAVWSGVSVGDCGGNSGTITYTTPVTRYWVGNAGSWSNIAKWSASSGGAGNETVPLCHDTVIFDPNSITSGSQTITCDMPGMGKDITFTGVANTPALVFSQSSYVFGSLTLDPNMTLSGTARALYFESRNNHNLTSGGLSIPHALLFSNYSNTAILQDNLLTTNQIYLSANCKLNLNNKNYNALRLYQYAGVTLTLGNGIMTLTDPMGFDGLSFVGSTVIPNNSTIILNSTSASNKIFNGGSLAYNNLKFTGNLGAMVIVGNNTFNTLEVDSTAGANTLTLTAGTTQALQKLFLNSTSANKSTVNSTTTTNATLSSTKDQFIRHAVITDVNVTGGGNWYYDAGSVTMGDGTGWTSSAVRNFSTFNTAKNTFNETNNTLGGNTTSKY